MNTQPLYNTIDPKKAPNGRRFYNALKASLLQPVKADYYEMHGTMYRAFDKSEPKKVRAKRRKCPQEKDVERRKCLTAPPKPDILNEKEGENV
jgi:hypothetical protein